MERRINFEGWLILVVLLMFMFSYMDNAHGYDLSSITFQQNSTAKASITTPNAVVITQYTKLAPDPAGTTIQGFAPKEVTNYYLTKSTTHTFGTNAFAYMLWFAQDTKVYFGTDLTNYFTVPANTFFPLVRP